MRALVARGLPLVVVDRELLNVAHDCVMTDHEAGGYVATEHLAQLGHTHIACIAGPSELGSSTGRVAGHRAALRAAGLNVDASLIVRGDFRDHSGYSAAQKLLKRANPPTAIFACNDLMAIGAMAAARDAGLNIPEDLSVVGFDDIHLAGYLNPPLTTIAQPMAELGRVAAELLLERMKDNSLPPRRIMLRNRLVIRRTTATVPRRSARYFTE
jgi:LacI family transcriptional regulator